MNISSGKVSTGTGGERSCFLIPASGYTTFMSTTESSVQSPLCCVTVQTRCVAETRRVAMEGTIYADSLLVDGPGKSLYGR